MQGARHGVESEGETEYEGYPSCLMEHYLVTTASLLPNCRDDDIASNSAYEGQISFPQTDDLCAQEFWCHSGANQHSLRGTTKDGKPMKPLARPSRIPLWIALLVAIVCSATVTSAGWSDSGNERDASIQQSANSASSTNSASFVGMYALQALIDFDSLEGAQFDPATGTLALFGRRLRPDRPLRVAYLDLLAAALEANSPTFSLRWTPASQREVEESKQNQNGFFNIFDSTHHLNVLGAWLFRQGGIKVDPCIDFDSLGKKVNQAGGWRRSLPTTDQLWCRLKSFPWPLPPDPIWHSRSKVCLAITSGADCARG